MRSLAVVALLIACGDDAPMLPDGRYVDAEPYVRGIVTVHVVDKNELPIDGMDVIFVDVDKTQTRTMTDGSGVAQAMVYPGANVTAVRVDSSMQGYSLTTVQSIVPGDDITLVSAPAAASPSEDAFGQGQIPLATADITTATKSGSTGTFTTLAAHGLAVGDFVIVSNVNPSGYNGTWQVSAVTPTTFSASIGSGGLGDGTGGLAAKAARFMLSYPAVSGATGYTINTSCGPFDAGTSTTPQLTLRAGCTSATTDIVITARGAAMYMQQTAVPTTGTTSLSGSWQSLATVIATVSNISTHNIKEIEVDRFVPYVRGPASVANASATNPTTLMLTSPLAPRAVMQTRGRCPSGTSGCLSNMTGTAQQIVTEVVDGSQTSYSLDFFPNMLDWVTASYDPQRVTIDVNVVERIPLGMKPGDTPDFFEASLRYVRGQVIYTWRVFGPTPGDVTFPWLPPDLPGDPNLRPTDAQGAYHVMLCETDALSGYRTVVSNVYVALGMCQSSASITSRPLGANKVRVSRWN